MRIEYRTIEGEIIERIIENDYATVEDIDCLACQYFEKTGREPEAIFMDYSWLAKLQNAMAAQARYLNPTTTGVASYMIEAFMLSIGQIKVVPVRTSYIPILVGSRVEFEDNDINQVFEDVVLKDCERI